MLWKTKLYWTKFFSELLLGHYSSLYVYLCACLFRWTYFLKRYFSSSLFTAFENKHKKHELKTIKITLVSDFGLRKECWCWHLQSNSWWLLYQPKKFSYRILYKYNLCIITFIKNQYESASNFVWAQSSYSAFLANGRLQ